MDNTNQPQILSIESAKELIEFIYNTNYKIAPQGDGVFNSKEEALSHVDSGNYDPTEPLRVCFDTKQGDYWDSVDVTRDSEWWYCEDHSMGGCSVKGKTLTHVLLLLYKVADKTCQYSPQKLVILNKK